MLEIDSTTEVQFISDGADCYWRRVHLVKKVVEDKGGKFSCLLDYYHMKGYLHQMAGAVKDWTKKQRTQWIRKMTKFLFEGNNALFEKEVEKLRKGSHKKSILPIFAATPLLLEASASCEEGGRGQRRQVFLLAGLLSHEGLLTPNGGSGEGLVAEEANAMDS